MNEETRVFLIDLRPGQYWVRYDDANVIALAAHLDRAAQDMALIDAGRPDLV